jgi:hypothetical protein
VKRLLILGVVGLLLVAAALGIDFMVNRREQAPAPAMTAGPAPGATPGATLDATPGATQAPPHAAVPAPAPSFDVVRINPQGDAVIAGRAAPEAQVHVFDGEREIGSVTADQRGQWVLLPSQPLPSGRQELSLLAEPPGAPAQRSDKVVVQVAPSQRIAAAPDPSPADPSPADAQAVVAPGNSLWGLARQRYGQGAQYATILKANREQIRDPNLIYPGQIFVMPPGP